MKLLALTIAGLVAGAAVYFNLPCRTDAVAIAGCCKQSSGRQWTILHRDFERCKRDNVPDRDNIFQPTGRIWWDTRC